GPSRAGRRCSCSASWRCSRASASRSPPSPSICGSPIPTRRRARRSSPGSAWPQRRRASSPSSASSWRAAATRCPSGCRSSPPSPLLAVAMLLFLLSLGGIPFVAGFWAKLYVLWAAAEAGLYWLVLLGAILTVVALFYYLVIARRMYIDPPTRPEPIPLAPTMALCVIVCVLGV